MAEDQYKTDLLQALNHSLANFEAAGPAFEEDVENLKAKIAKVEGGKTTTAAPKKRGRPRKTTAKKG